MQLLETPQEMNIKNMELPRNKEAENKGRNALEMLHLRNIFFKRLLEKELETESSPWRRASLERFLRLHTRED